MSTRTILKVALALYITIMTAILFFWWFKAPAKSKPQPNEPPCHPIHFENTTNATTTTRQPVSSNSTTANTTSEGIVNPIHSEREEPIHILLAVCGQKKAREARVLIRSAMIFSHKSRLHFHFLVDREAKAILGSVIDIPPPESKDPRFNVTWYDVNAISELSHKHLPTLTRKLNKARFSCASNKLLVDTLFHGHPEVKRVLVLDADTMLVSSIDPILEEFDRLQYPKVIGLSPEMSTWYSKIDRSVPVYPPHQGRNSGVMLFDLDGLRRWASGQVENQTFVGATNGSMVVGPWSMFLEEQIKTLDLEFSLAEQDLINPILVRYPEIVHDIECRWNFQLVSEKNPPHCDTSTRFIIHGNGNMFADPSAPCWFHPPLCSFYFLLHKTIQEHIDKYPGDVFEYWK